ncbi:hypothetical protein [Marivivens aquimaris]|uniref:hypothetical protein n=1 Tax=Marivivens aquimaris TaxID=2774876 RepID=UPI00187DF7F1|nr:hypothetical protein [Marivivens aquimaris]
MKTVIAVLTLVALAGCGADGAPIRPVANLGLTVNQNGQLATSCNVGGTNGTVSVNVAC